MSSTEQGGGKRRAANPPAAEAASLANQYPPALINTFHIHVVRSGALVIALMAGNQMDERRIVGWRVAVSEKRWIFFADLQRADNLAQERNATLQECYSDGSVHTIRAATNKRPDGHGGVEKLF